LWHISIGDSVEPFLAGNGYDRVYCGAIFTWTVKKAQEKGQIPQGCTCGGTGFDLEGKLPVWIEDILPRVNYGFTTRGCIRRCGFCVVWKKEGKFQITGDALDLWDGTQGATLTLYDNNILADPQHFDLVCRQVRDNGLYVDFNQGLDHRLLTPEIADIIKKSRLVRYRFAFDNTTELPSVEAALDILAKVGIKQCEWYVLAGFNGSDVSDAYLRVNWLRNHGQRVYLQRFNYINLPGMTPLAQWANQPRIFGGMTFKQFLEIPDTKHKNYAKQVYEAGLVL
jgi:hypothetical protein